MSTENWKDPKIACELLSHIDRMQTGGWKSQGVDDLHFCCTPYKELGNDFPIANNIAYYAEGDPTEVENIHLYLNVNVPTKAKEAHNELLWHGQAMLNAALSAEIPADLKEAILNGTSGQWDIGGCNVTLECNDRPSGKGYGMKLQIQ